MANEPGLGSQALCLLFSAPDVSISVHQAEERTSYFSDRNAVHESLTGMVNRDRMGRLRVQLVLSSQGRSEELPINILDPVNGFTAVLIQSIKAAYLVPVPAASGYEIGNPLPGFKLPHAKNWNRVTFHSAPRLINGLLCDGLHFRDVPDEQPSMQVSLDLWTSSKLGLIGEFSEKGPGGIRTAKLTQIVQGEPDPQLFVIPSDYTTTTLEVPPVSN